jgi:hypothetical protein
MHGKTVHHPSAPAVTVAAHGRIDERAFLQRSAGIGNQQRRMDSHRRSNASAGRTGSGRIVERELRLVHFTADDAMLRQPKPS